MTDLLAAVPERIRKNRDLSVGIVGFGRRALLWRHVHKPGAGSIVAMVCDTSERGLQDVQQKIPTAALTSNRDELLGAGLDACWF